VMRRFLALGMALAGIACSGSAGTVTMQGREFAPRGATVKVGEKVTWTNESEEVHTVTAYEDSLSGSASYWASGGALSEDAAREDPGEGFIPAGDTFEFSFEVPGTYRYFCIPHEDAGMVGTITVIEE
jgi:plastocyanin